VNSSKVAGSLQDKTSEFTTGLANNNVFARIKRFAGIILQNSFGSLPKSNTRRLEA